MRRTLERNKTYRKVCMREEAEAARISLNEGFCGVVFAEYVRCGGIYAAACPFGCTPEAEEPERKPCTAFSRSAEKQRMMQTEACAYLPGRL